MTGLKLGGLTLTTISIILGGCAAPEPTLSGKSHSALGSKDDDSASDVGADQAAPTRAASQQSAPQSAATPVTAPAGSAAAPPASLVATPEIQVSYNLDLKQSFGGQVIGRACSDRGADLQNATFLDGTTMYLVSVDYPDKTLPMVSGAQLTAMQQQMVATGDFVLPVEPSLLPTTPYEFAIIMGGDDWFGNPADCGVSLKPTSADERDARNFPNNDLMIFNGKFGGTGCGTVGYLSAYWDAGQQKVIAQATSQFLLAAWDGDAGFPAMQDRTPCDVNHSPLVLDIEGHGVSLTGPIEGIFDIDGDGTRDALSWVGSDDTPFLVRDANGNGIVDGIDELFGDRTRGPNGLRSGQNGFEALAAWDSERDGIIDDRDEVWPRLKLWFDRNHDGRTDRGELESLEARGVRSIALSFVSVRQDLWASGRVRGAVRQRGGATMTDGRILGVLDVWLDTGL